MKNKTIALGLAFATLTWAIPMIGQAVTSAEIQANIDLLLQQIVVLQTQIGASSSASYTFTRDLTIGSEGADVTALQQMLIAGGYLKISVPTGVFGPLTQAAVSAWQVAKGISPTTGYFGPLSRAAAVVANVPVTVTTYPAGCTSAAGFSSTTGLSCSLVTTYPAGCTSAVGYSVTTGLSCATVTTFPAGCTSATGFSSTTGLSCATVAVTAGTEGAVKDFSVGSAEETSVSEGQTDVELIAFDVELENDGDLKLDRFDLYMGETNGGGESSKPWDYFKTAKLFAGSTEIATMDVSSKSDWAEYDTGTLDTTSQEYRLRFTGLNSILESDETTTLSVKFDMASTIDTADEGADWEFGIEDDSFRFIDGTNYMFTDGDEDVEDVFTLDTAVEAALDLSSATSDPDASVINVDDDSDTNGVIIGVFDIEETEGVDVNITEMEVELATSDVIDDVVKTLYLYNGSTKVGEENVTDDIVTFDNIDLDVAGDDTVTLTVKADFDDTNDQVRYQNGDTIQVASVDLTEFTDEYDNDEGDIEVDGEFAGEVHTLYATGIMVTLDSVNALSVTVEGANNDRAELTIKFKVKSFGDDLYVVNAETGTSFTTTSALVAPSTTEGIGYHIQYAGGAAAPDATTVTGTTLTSTATEEDHSYLVEKNDTETFTLKIVVTNDGNPDLSGASVRALLAGIGWGDTDIATADSVYTFNLTDYATDYAVIAD